MCVCVCVCVCMYIIYRKQVVARAESEARVEELPIYYKRTDAMILTIISSVYSEKSIADFMDTQRHQIVQVSFAA